MASLERAAHTTLHLVQELKSSTAEVTSLTSVHKADASTAATTINGNADDPTSAAGNAAESSASSSTGASALPNLRAPLPEDTDKAQFLMKLAPRIRRLEADTVRSLTARLEDVLGQMKVRKDEERDSGSGGGTGGRDGDTDTTALVLNKIADAEEEERDLIMIGHCLRGLALLGRGKEAEGAFARVAIM